MTNAHPAGHEVLPTEAFESANVVPQTHFPGIGANGKTPPDPNIAIGPDHIVEVVNVEIAVFNKSGSVYAGYPKKLNLLWSNLGGSCAVNNGGDTIVQYDRLADRFLVSQLQKADANFPFPGCWLSPCCF